MPEQENKQAPETLVAVPKVFSGALSIDEALSPLQLPLYDLAARNRLPDFKSRAANALQAVDAIPNSMEALTSKPIKSKK